MNRALVLRGVKKRYGRGVALDGLDLEVPKGAIVGLVGPNGAGKTTTFGIISGAVQADAGEVSLLGEGPFDPARHAGRVSVLPQDCELNPHSSATQLLTYFARLQGLSRAEANKESERLLEMVDLRDRSDARVRQLSHGMRRRLAVAQALIGSPELILLDEPTGGLDPKNVVRMREVIRSLRGEHTVIVSTHILSDVERTCDRVAFMEKGRCIEHAPMHELKERSRVVRVRLAAPASQEQLESIASAFEGRALSPEHDTLTYQLLSDDVITAVQPELVSALVSAGLLVVSVDVTGDLEAAYLAVSKTE